MHEQFLIVLKYNSSENIKYTVFSYFKTIKHEVTDYLFGKHNLNTQ